MPATSRITDGQRRARLGVRHRLAAEEQIDDVAAITSSVVALHSTDPATVYLSAMARMKQPSIAAVSTALYDDRTVVRHHAMRRTLWVFTPEVARLAHAACTTALAAAQWKRLARMVEDSGIAANGADWVAVARADTLTALGSIGTATARQLGKAVPALTEKLHLGVGKSYAATQGAHTRLLLNLGFDGAIVRGRPNGTWINSEYPWSVTERWLAGGLSFGSEVTAATAAAELARCYLAQFGPATTADLQWWAGWTATTTRRALSAIDAIEVDIEGDVGWVLPDDGAGVGDGEGDTAGPWIAFLPALDSTTMGWKGRSWYLGDIGSFGGPVFDRNGNAGPTIWVDGRVVGGWAQRRTGEIAYQLLVDVPRSRHKAIAAEAERVRDLIGDVRVNVRFPAPMQRELLA